MSKKGSWPSRLWRTALWLALAGVALTAGTVALLRWVDPPQSAFMVEARVAAWMNGNQEAGTGRPFEFRQRWVELRQISPNLALAVVASEDQKFPEHWGFDVEAIEKAYELNRHSHRVRGASTITQQVAKNLFLWSGRSYLRKGLEAYFTVLIEALWPKRRILEVYLNIAEFGPGTYGAAAASERFFHEPAARLSRADAALLAAVLPNPQLYLVSAPSRFVQQRRAWIEGQMQALGGPEMLSEIDAYPDRRR